MNWLIIGITGVTCSGKSTLARSIISEINAKNVQFPEYITIGSVKLIKQDDYFHPKTSAQHTWISELNYINREVISALNMSKMFADVNDILGPSYQLHKKGEKCVLNLLIIEGFLVFNYKDIRDICQIKIDIRLGYDECFRRRQNRKYNPPNPTGYFESILWPFYLKHLEEYKDVKDLQVLNGELSEDICLLKALEHITNFC